MNAMLGLTVLMVTPIPSHPQDQGNSARIFMLGRLLQSAGARVHLLYHPLEGLDRTQRATMERDWDALHVVPVERMNLAPHAEGHHFLDDWYEPRVTQAARALHGRYGYAAVIAHYVWFSAVLEAFGPETLKILDTHDVFGGRADRFRGAGMEPAWFWTTPEEEARGLARADIVLAIQDEEAATFRALGHPDVRVFGYLHPWRQRAARNAADCTIGYLASGNPINVASFQALRLAVLAQGGVPHARLVVAGSICGRLPHDLAPFAAMGPVADVDAFYDRVDLVVNPMTFGTGLKIKSVEAVFEGMPLVATAAAMVGLPECHSLHALADAVAVAACLPALAADPAARAELTAASVQCAGMYASSVQAAARRLFDDIAAAALLCAATP